MQSHKVCHTTKYVDEDVLPAASMAASDSSVCHLHSRVDIGDGHLAHTGASNRTEVLLYRGLSRTVGVCRGTIAVATSHATDTVLGISVVHRRHIRSRYQTI